jgi:hypothetical protein
MADDINYWITPVGPNLGMSAEQIVEILVAKHKIFAFGDRSAGRKHMKAGDWICFYVKSRGVSAHARIGAPPKLGNHPEISDTRQFPWVMSLEHPSIYVQNPIPLDEGLRSKLDAFHGKSVKGYWSWIVQSAHRLTKMDFLLVTGGGPDS